jgi:hypothetical protein
MQTCSLDGHQIKDEHVELCEKWDYWNPNRPWKDGGLYGKCCNGCKNYEYRTDNK